MPSWKCKPECQAGCCGIIPIDKDLYNAAKAEGLCQFEPKEEVEGELSRTDSTSFILATTEDGSCIFLNRTTFLCSIYSRRPNICRMFGQDVKLLCPHIDLKGNPRDEKQVKRVTRYMDAQFDKRFENIKRKFNVRTP